MNEPRPIRAGRIIYSAPGQGKRTQRKESWRTFVALDPEELEDLDFVIESIKHGLDLPDRFYSATAGHPDSDPLLRDYGVMHLHLGGKGSDTLLFLMQFADRVVLLETNTHRRFQRQCAELIRQHRLSPAPGSKVEIRKSRKPKKNGNGPRKP